MGAARRCVRAEAGDTVMNLQSFGPTHGAPEPEGLQIESACVKLFGRRAFRRDMSTPGATVAVAAFDRATRQRPPMIVPESSGAALGAPGVAIGRKFFPAPAAASGRRFGKDAAREQGGAFGGHQRRNV